jgi:hypothetical protein
MAANMQNMHSFKPLILGLVEFGYPRKAGHPLEGSCQEAKHLPYPPFCIFLHQKYVAWHLTPDLPFCPRPCLQRFWYRSPCGDAPDTHQDQGSLRSRLWARPLPLAPIVPQKTLGTLPCPIVMITVHVAPPNGSTPKLARGRGVAET